MTELPFLGGATGLVLVGSSLLWLASQNDTEQTYIRVIELSFSLVLIAAGIGLALLTLL